MRVRFTTLVAVAVSLAASQAALAADMPVKGPAVRAPVMAPAFSWTGFYIGGHIGGSWADVDWIHTNTGGIVEPFSQKDSDFAYGGHAGAMYQWSNIVLGIEGTYTRHDLSATNAAVLSADRSNSFDLKSTVTVVGRLGLAWDRWLAYVQGGWATAEIDFRRFVTSTGATTASSSGWDHGWTVGVGGAYAVHPNVILGVEYNYLRIDIDNRTNVLAPGFTGTDTVTGARADLHQVTGRLSIKFP